VIGLLDPALFLPRADQDVERDLTLVIRTCRDHAIQLVQLDEYWRDLWTDFARPLERQLGPSARRVLQELRKWAVTSTRYVPALVPAAGKAWWAGFAQLFGDHALGVSWEEKMARATLRAVVADQDVVMLTRRIPGRNLASHAAGGSTLDETTRWVLHVQPKGIGHRQILCVHHPRNIRERWTARFDWRLPSSSDGARYPFCPPGHWWKGATPAHRTIESKPAWLDKHGNGWARPNIAQGAGYHWDVFIQDPTLQQVVGLPQINVVEFGAPDREGNAGQLHHVPTAKLGKPTDTGWSC
jgi:hypothetical protein